MIKRFKKFIIVSIILFYPIIVSAEPKEYISVRDNVSRTVDALDIKSLHFVDNTDKPSNNYGITAEITNTLEQNIVLKTKINYYNKEKILIYSKNSEYQLKSGQDNTFLDLIDSRQNSKYDVSDIEFYTIDFETREGTIKNENLSAKLEDSCQNTPYTIENYNATIDVLKDNTYQVHEDITIYYSGEKQIIKRNIPFKRSIKNRNDSISKFNIKLLKVDVNQNFSSHFNISSGTLVILDNSEENTIKETNYTMDYKYAVNSKSTEDEFHFTIDSSDWNSCVSNISFTINMPSNFDATTLQIISEDGKDISKKVEINKSGNTITGTYDDILKEEDNITISLFLGKNYFEKKKTSLSVLLIFIIPTCLLSFSFILWYFFGRDKKIEEKQSKQLPKNKNILELILATNGYLNREDILIMLMKLADDGYIRFEKNGRDTIFKTVNYDIIKVKEYCGKNIEEKKLLMDLFDYRLADFNEQLLKKNYTKGKASKKLLDMRGLTTSTKDLHGKLIPTADSIISSVIEKSYDKIYEKSATILSKIVSIFGYLIGLFITILPTFEYGSIEDTIIMAILFFLVVISIKEGIMNSKKPTTRIASLIMITLAFLVSKVTPVWETLIYEKIYIHGILYGILTIALNSILVYVMPKKTSYGTEIDEQLYSLKVYLKSLTEEDLKTRIGEEPKFFSKVLPYVFILNLDRDFLKLIEGTDCPLPDWIEGIKIQDIKGLIKDLELLIKNDKKL